jgi:hypothetical protein
MRGGRIEVYEGFGWGNPKYQFATKNPISEDNITVDCKQGGKDLTVLT